MNLDVSFEEAGLWFSSALSTCIQLLHTSVVVVKYVHDSGLSSAACFSWNLCHDRLRLDMRGGFLHYLFTAAATEYAYIVANTSKSAPATEAVATTAATVTMGFFKCQQQARSPGAMHHCMRTCW